MINFIIWILLGAFAGWVAGRLMKGSGYGLPVNAVLGILGSFVGGWLFSFIGLNIAGGLGSFIAAVVGAMAIIGVANLLKR
ncbi:GlsB/YeaQ/YmgE family stress response membrane protein [Anaerolineales bacterium HSG6]|nr:GlsB/YeaQ/YmgE family stress response membrane protein [Anaerolineales bacterium HSG6]